jgi:hypothetical protein
LMFYVPNHQNFLHHPLTTTTSRPSDFNPSSPQMPSPHSPTCLLPSLASGDSGTRGKGPTLLSPLSAGFWSHI